MELAELLELPPVALEDFWQKAATGCLGHGHPVEDGFLVVYGVYLIKKIL